MSGAYTGFTVCLYGIDAEKVGLRRDEVHNALYLELGDDVHIRLSLDRQDVCGLDREGELERDRMALRELADVAEQAAQEIEQLQRAQDGGNGGS